MNFTKKKIGSNLQTNLSFKNRKPVFKKKPKNFKFKKKHLFLLPIFLCALVLVFYTFNKTYNYFSDKSFLESIFSPVLKNLEKDEKGLINILLLGNGGGNHDGADLTDTMIIASLNPQTKNVVMLSVPRDFWVNTKRFGSSRINEIYRNTKLRLINNYNFKEDSARKEAIRILKEKISEITKIKIPYYAQINFYGFIELIDALGGITVNVEKKIYDENYPDFNWGTELFELNKGIQKLDGETALKFARSRHNTSDFDRAKRQQKIINASKEKALGLGVLSSPQKLYSLYEVFEKNFKTNFNKKELISLALLSKDINTSAIENSVLNDNWQTEGGFLGVPPRKDYGGAYVLIPYSGETNYERIQIYTKLYFYYRHLLNKKFEVLNSTYYRGLGSKSANRLERYGFDIVSIDNYEEELKESELWIYQNFNEFKKIEPLLDKIFPIKLVDKSNYYEETDIIGTFIIGKNYK
jgi:LCP family protein required for cell wall assembly